MWTCLDIVLLGIYGRERPGTYLSYSFGPVAYGRGKVQHHMYAWLHCRQVRLWPFRKTGATMDEIFSAIDRKEQARWDMFREGLLSGCQL